MTTDRPAPVWLAAPVDVDGSPVPLVEARLVPLEGAFNLRDLGGYTGADGRRVRYGRLYRSDSLAKLTDADLALVERLGIRAIHDLRTAGEIERAPHRLPEGADVRQVRHAPPELEQAMAGIIDFVQGLLDGTFTMAEAGDRLDGSYLSTLTQSQRMFGSLCNAIADEEHLPALFNCQAGKDRTGIAAALVLRLLGVDDDTIVEDFALSNRYRLDRRMGALDNELAKRNLDPALVQRFVRVDPAQLIATLERIDAEFGGTEGYLTGGGMDAAVPARLRELLLEL